MFKQIASVRVCAAVVVAALGIGSPIVGQAQVIGVTDDTVVIGGMGPLTGPVAPLVAPQLRGVEAVFLEVNDAGGIHGRKIRYVMQDDQCNPTAGVGAVKKLIYEEEPFMLVGGGCSNAALAQKPVIVEAKVPWVIVASTADSLTEPADPYIFTTMSAAWMEVYGALQVAIDDGAERIAVVWQNDAWGKARIEPLRKALADKGIEPVAVEEIALEPSDATPTVLRLQAANPDAVILMLFPKAGIPLIRDAYKLGFQPLMVGGSPLGGIDVIAQGAGTADAVVNFRAVLPVGYGADDPRVGKWKEIIETRYPKDVFQSWHMFGISSGQFAVEALRRAGPDLTREKIIDVMSTLSIQTDTYAGPLECTPTDHQCHRVLGIFALEDGRVVSVGASRPTR